MATEWTPAEMMAVRASEELREGEVVFVGIGLPNLACNLARATHAPNLFLIYESGAVGALPERLPVSIGDPALVTNCLSIVNQADIFQCYLQRGLIDVGFLGGAQMDRYGNLNTTTIGDYHNPTVRLPGSGGACEIAIHSKRLLIVMRMNKKAFVEKCDFVTSPGHRFESKFGSADSGNRRQDFHHPGLGPVRVISDLCVCEFVEGEMVVTEIFEGVTVDSLKQSCGWPIKISSNLKTPKPPSQEALHLLRDKLDPQRLYL